MSKDYEQTSVSVRGPTLTLFRELKRGPQSNDELLLTMALLCTEEDLTQGFQNHRDDAYEDLVEAIVNKHGLDYLDLDPRTDTSTTGP